MRVEPVRGMRDRGIDEMPLRSATLKKIIDCYERNGFFRIETPIVEDAENISRSDGGDNLSLVFEIMKRGDKLRAAIESGSGMSDMALRYDLTLPLSRFYAANAARLPNPFKVIQTGRVYRAERPQKGRLREFTQCDIDIIGDDSPDCEVELFSTSLEALAALGLGKLELVLNDRRILKSIVNSFGFADEDFMTVCVSLDKIGKIGAQAVVAELSEKSVKLIGPADPKRSAADLVGWLLSNEAHDLFSSRVKDASGPLRRVMDTLGACLPEGCSIKYSPSLVRGQGYYTGIVAEVVCEGSSASIAGGGRYDGMIGKFLGRDVSAAGISIGFERIIEMLRERGARLGGEPSRLALLHSGDDDFAQVLKLKADLMENSGCAVHLFRDVKSRKKLFNALEPLGFDRYCDFRDRKIVPFKG